MNASFHSATGARPGDDVPDTLELLLLKKNSRAAEHNARIHASIKARYPVGTRFRVAAAKQQRGARRSYLARFTPEVHTVLRHEREKVIDETGRAFPVKLLNPTGERAVVRRRLPPRPQ